MALPLTLNRVSGSLLGTVENILIPRQLQAFGMTAKDAISAFGRITGMAMPLIFFPSAFLTALAITLVPAISEASALKNAARVSQTVGKSIMFTAVLGIGAAGVYIVLPEKLGMTIYHQDIAHILRFMGLLCPLWYVNITLSGILNGLGQQVFIFKYSLLSSAISIAFIFFLVPVYGADAFIYGWFASILVVTVASVLKIKNVAKITVKIGNWFVKPILCSAATCLGAAYLSKKFIFPAVGDIAGLIITIVFIAGVYLALVTLLGCIKISDFRLASRKHKNAVS